MPRITGKVKSSKNKIKRVKNLSINCMKNKLLVCYPSGAGGWWLSNLIHKLETNSFFNEATAVVNFHKHTHSNSVYLSHYPITPIDKDLLENTYKINFTGNCLFNFYLNVVHKLYFDSNKLGLTDISYPQDCHLLSCESLNKFNFPSNADLDYGLIFTNHSLFIDNLFQILDTAKFKYTKNVEICKLSIDQFKHSCPNPGNYYLDYDNIVWQGWCLGILKYLKEPIPEYNVFLRDRLRENHSKFVEITSSKILLFQGE
jgi:hypothetical protein